MVLNMSKSVHQSTPSNPLHDETDQTFYSRAPGVRFLLQVCSVFIC